MSILKTIISGIRQSLKGAKHKILFLGTTIAMLFLFTLIPVFVIEGNDFLFQLSIFTPQEVFLLTFLSLLYALYITMFVYALRLSKQSTKLVGGSVGGVSGGLSALFAGIAGSAACSACLAPLFAFFGIGFGGVLFVLEYRYYFIVGIAILMLVAIYLTARKIKMVCDER